MAKKAEDGLKGLKKKYHISKKSVEPSVHVKITDNWIDLHIKYITDARNR